MGADTRQAADLTILFTCVGRRIELLQAFRAAAAALGLRLRIAAADRDLTAPGLSCADEPLITPAAGDPGYIRTLLDAVRRLGVAALIPTIDTDLQVLADHRAEFEAAGCRALIAAPEVIRVCRDKIATYEFLRRAGFDAPRTYTPAELPGLAQSAFPLFLKPRDGSASRRVHKLETRADLDYHLPRVRDAIVQEFVEGVEHTLDVYVGLGGAPRCVVPRARWQVRNGEVSKGVVVKDREIMELGRRVTEALGPSPRGLVTLQCIVTPQRRIRFIEVNPRFGGGAPLGIAAGADYPRWLLEELSGRAPSVTFDGFADGVCMLRYDWSVFLPLGDGVPKLVPPLRDWPEFD